MKKKWFAIIDYVKYPLSILMIGYILTTIAAINPETPLLNAITTACGYFGTICKDLFPLSIIVCYVGQKYKTKNPSVAILTSIASYMLLNVVSMFSNDGSFASYFYTNLLGIQYSSVVDGITIVHQPLNIGLIGSLLVIAIIVFAHDLAEKRYNYGILTFISNEVSFFINSMVLTVLIGLLGSWAYIYIVQFLTRLLTGLSRNSANPAFMFIYALFDKLSHIFGFGNIIEDTFWLGSLGGSYVDINGFTYAGDMNIWTTQYLNGTVEPGVGKFITIYYIVNVFMIPAIVLGLWVNTRNKIQKQRTLGLAIVAILASVICGAGLPVELTLLFIAPGLLAAHLVFVAIVNLILSMFNVNLGYVLTTSAKYADVGNVIDLVRNYKRVDTIASAKYVLIIGLICFVVYFIMTWIYYNVLSHEFLDRNARHTEEMKFVKAIGGISNITMITATTTQIIVVLKDEDKLSSSELEDTHAYGITKRYFGYVIDFGPASNKMCYDIRKMMKDYEECQKYHYEVN